MFSVAAFRLCERRPRDGSQARGLSCDEKGIYLAGEVPLVTCDIDETGKREYRPRPPAELSFALSAGYGMQVDLSSRMNQLAGAATHMSAGNWAAASLATLNLRLPDLPDSESVARLVKADRITQTDLRPHRDVVGDHCPCGCATTSAPAGKRDVSDGPRIPRSPTGGGRWTIGSGGLGSDPNIFPAQVLVPPLDIPAPFELPMPPGEITPFPFDVPGVEKPFSPPYNPYPRKKKCVEEWDAAYEFCGKLARKKPPGFKPGYGGYGKGHYECLLGQVSEECGGRAKDA